LLVEDSWWWVVVRGEVWRFGFYFYFCFCGSLLYCFLRKTFCLNPALCLIAENVVRTQKSWDVEDCDGGLGDGERKNVTADTTSTDSI